MSGRLHIRVPAPTASNPTPPAPTPTGGCDQTLWAHVYNSSRLHVLTDCTTVSGTVELVRSEADGDYHIQLHLDSQFAGLLNDKNISDQNGNLVLEPVCEHAITQADAVSACQGFTDNIPVPSVGQHISVTGSYVLDADHGWMEIHPVSTINGQGGGSPTPTPSPVPTPTPGTDICTVSSPIAAPCGTATAVCSDGTLSCSQNRSGTCSGHGGHACWICPGPLCGG